VNGEVVGKFHHDCCRVVLLVSEWTKLGKRDKRGQLDVAGSMTVGLLKLDISNGICLVIGQSTQRLRDKVNVESCFVMQRSYCEEVQTRTETNDEHELSFGQSQVAIPEDLYHIFACS
jgi:hypothetical protein